MSGSLRTFPTDTAVGGMVGTTHFDGCPFREWRRGGWGTDGEPPASGQTPACDTMAQARLEFCARVPGPLGNARPKGPSFL